MKYKIGDILQNEDGDTGIVCIEWTNGDLCHDETEQFNHIIGHWPRDCIVESAERERRK